MNIKEQKKGRFDIIVQSFDGSTRKEKFKAETVELCKTWMEAISNAIFEGEVDEVGGSRLAVARGLR